MKNWLRVSKVTGGERPWRDGNPWSLARLLLFCVAFINIVITLSWELEMTIRLLHWKVNLVIFPTTYSMHHEILHNNTGLHEKFSITSIPGWLLVFWVVSTNIVITLYCEVQMMRSLLHWKVGLIIFPKKSSWTSIALGNQELWLFVSANPCCHPGGVLVQLSCKPSSLLCSSGSSFLCQH
jgi:hypothetical protein